MYLLDTNACIVYLRYPDSNLRLRLASVSPQEVVVCSIVKAELFYGALRSRQPDRNLALQQEFLNQFQSLPFDDTAAMFFGRIRSQLTALGTPIGPYDLQIAAIALAHNCALVTHNVREFDRVDGLRVENWQL
ncbi:MAG: type II toxin-antitoxin system VapC family toxin [Spirulinaceae cyanobacterium RM2_2_10]|nr:type II toxin-antitoxin system VapC family toxin [Spirulinaceae cyanobacterium SM2_1_0]NJO19943.1 type II toxin-antitoxin system VapC family toxin [Spirulinaceae cyanobacterium RM2_2_10]